MNLLFCGAARTVTGSCFLLKNSSNVLIDIGMFQGSVEKRNHKPFPFNPSDIDCVIITHSHLDHIGLLPKLVKHGFDGEIYSTKATEELAEHMLRDSAKIQEEEAYTQTKKNLRKGLPKVYPLYTEEDVERCFKLKWICKNEFYIDDMHVKFKNSGHILGSAFVEIEVDKKIIFSGDVGEPNRPIIKDTEFPDKTDYLVVESTYADRNHKSVEESVKELKDAINDTFERGGNVIIPSFALERTQEILYILHKLYYSNEIPECQIFLDSPLAIDITQVFLKHPELYDKETLNEFKRRNPFYIPNLQFARSVEESKEINEIKSGAIIIAGSGMCNGGRVKHHLKHNLWRRECSIVFVGYQVKGTLGRRIVDGAKKVRIYGENIAVKAKIYTINGFSAHAGRDYLIEWSCKSDADKIFVVHGEFDKNLMLANALKQRGFECIIPNWLQSFELA